MRTVWTARVGVLNLNNVPSRGEKVARLNMVDLLQQFPDLLALTEAGWDGDVMAGIHKAADGHFRFVAPSRNSAVLGYHVEKWKLRSHGTRTLHGAVASRVFGVVSDRRLMPWAVLEHVHNGRQVVFGVLHVAPPATKRGRVAMAAAAAARSLAWRRLRRWARRSNLPVIVAGDWNEKGPVLGDTIGGRQVRFSNPRNIDRVETVDGRFVTLAPSVGRKVKIRSIDHPGAILTTVYATVER